MTEQPFPYAIPGYLRPSGPVPGASGRGPRVGPVIAATVFLGPFGAIFAARRADRARALGDSTGRYWLAFGGTLVGAWVVGAIALILSLSLSGVVSGDSGTARSASATALQLQQSIVRQGTFNDASGKQLVVMAATCRADEVLGSSATGAGTYRCTLGLADGSTDVVLISVDKTSHWRVTGQAK